MGTQRTNDKSRWAVAGRALAALLVAWLIVDKVADALYVNIR